MHRLTERGATVLSPPPPFWDILSRISQISQFSTPLPFSVSLYAPAYKAWQSISLYVHNSYLSINISIYHLPIYPSSWYIFFCSGEERSNCDPSHPSAQAQCGAQSKKSLATYLHLMYPWNSNIRLFPFLGCFLNFLRLVILISISGQPWFVEGLVIFIG